ncbi:MFS transporter [Peterkaempfera sp. SMS 1(5)a]|uniref:MFS transporter n=1 Tax=Peterkaempfera podocarpi TaxID=3232308 RepID=UPI003671A6BB
MPNSPTTLDTRRPTPSRHSRADPRPPRRLSATASLLLLASIIVSLLASSSAPTPLYATYQAQWHFTPLTTTIVFGVYAMAVLAALLTLGRLSDHLGRKPVLLAALAGQVIAMILMTTADGVPQLLIARVAQGLATGAALGALGAGMMDLHRDRGALANSVAPGIGTGTGAMLSALVVQFLPAPTHLIYLLLLAVFALQAAGVLLMPETVTRKSGALASLTPEISLPRTLRGPVLTAAPVLFAVWALAGFYGALGPALTRQLTGGTGSVLLGGLALFVLAGAAALAVILQRNTPARRLVTTGVAATVIGVAGVLASLSAGSVTGFFVATVIAGLGFGGGFQGGIRFVMPLAAPHQRAGVLSLLYTVSYLGLGLPAMVAGYLIVHVGGLYTTAREYGAVVILLAASALLGLLLRRQDETPGLVVVTSDQIDAALE